MNDEKKYLILDYIATNDLHDATNSEIARKANKDLNLNYDNVDSLRKYVAGIRQSATETTTNQYKQPHKHFNAIGDDGRLMDINAYCEHYNLPRKDIKSYKLVSHTAIPYYNIAFYETADNVFTEDYIYKLVEKVLDRSKPKPKTKLNNYKTKNKVARLVYTDVHIGMEVQDNGFSLYGGKWDEEEIENRRAAMVQEFINRCREESIGEIYIDDLGDFMDGYDGYTVRGGHTLPQNMDNQKAFDVGLNFKVKIVDELAASGLFNKIVCNNITEDNHSGSFGYIVNSAAKQVLSREYNIEYNIYRRFIDTYGIGKHCMMLSHGKDSKNLKFGFKPKLDDKGSEKITQYIQNNKLHEQYSYFTFSKGDSHQELFDHSTNDLFHYHNYPALSPSSAWVQVNYKRGKSGYVIELMDKEDRDVIIIPKTFNWIK